MFCFLGFLLFPFGWCGENEYSNIVQSNYIVKTKDGGYESNVSASCYPLGSSEGNSQRRDTHCQLSVRILEYISDSLQRGKGS